VSNNYDVKQVILMRTDLRNTKGEKVRSGKLMAQSAHAAMIWLSKRVQKMWASPATAKAYLDDSHGLRRFFSAAEDAWLMGSFAKIVLAVDMEQLIACVDHARSLSINAEVCTDNGNTEFGGVPTVTCAAIGPATSTLIDTITGRLKPL
jgi:PTH2 family peptidyl-tRNA hydrolase